MHYFKKMLVVLIIFLIPSMFLMAKGETEAEPEGDKSVELTVWFGRENFIPDDAFDAFHKKYPNITVKVDVIPLEQALTEASTSLSAGVGPDLLQTDSRRIPPLVEANLLYPMDEQLALWKTEDPESYNAVSSAGWEHGKYKGVAYGVAIFSGPFNYVYRKDWLEAAGLDVPKTWEEMLDVARALNNSEKKGYAVRGPSSTVWFSSHYMSMGGTYDANNVIQLDSEAGIYALQFYQTLVEDGLLSQDVLAWGSGDMRAAFITGRAAQAPIGTNIFPNIKAELEYGVEWGATAPLYREGAKDEYRYASLGWPMVATIKATNHPYEVGLVLRYLAEHEPAMSVAKRYQPTTVTTVWDDPSYIAEQPWASDFSEVMLNMVPTPPNLYITQMDQIILDALGEVMSDMNADPAEVAARYQKQLNSLF